MTPFEANNCGLTVEMSKGYPDRRLVLIPEFYKFELQFISYLEVFVVRL